MKESFGSAMFNEASKKDQHAEDFVDFPAVEKMIDKLNRPAFSFEDLENEHAKVARIEGAVTEMSLYEETLNKYLQRFGVDVPVQKIAEKLFQIQLEADDYQLEPLPSGYVYQGGAARAVLQRKLGLDEYAFPRDVDLGYAGQDADRSLDDALALANSPDDHQHGHGVSTVAEDYFATRDFTISELMVAGDKIILTKDCLLDTVRGILRFTEFEKKEAYQEDRAYHVHPKLLAKALRFAAQQELIVADSDVYQFQEIDAFHLALHLDRALEHSLPVAQAYLDNLKDKKQIPEYINSPQELIDYLSQETDYIFRCAKAVDLVAEEDVIVNDCGIDLEALAEKYDHLPKKVGMSRREN